MSLAFVFQLNIVASHTYTHCLLLNNVIQYKGAIPKQVRNRLPPRNQFRAGCFNVAMKEEL